jgi:carbonic anhydrase
MMVGSIGLAGLILAVQAQPAKAWQARQSTMETAIPEWSYRGEHGPAHWTELRPDEYRACENGRRQSPIAIDTDATVFQPCLPLRFRYRSSSLKLVNDGKALRLGYDRGSYLVVDGLSYELVEVRFHVPGEHRIDGRRPDAEIELIHGTNRGDIAVVSVPVQAGHRVNQTFRRILENAPKAAGTNAYGRNIGINALFLLPSRRAYYYYDGSLTRPPCKEGVLRYVLEEPVEVATTDLARLAQIVGANARPLQPLGDRQVHRACKTDPN